jgi:redox-sensing transcriptional repressor
MISGKTVGRLSLYRRLLESHVPERQLQIFSHHLAELACVTPAQVRRDLMSIGYSGTPGRGYSVKDLAGGIQRFLEDPAGQSVALVGVGNLGRAILSYFAGRRPHLQISAAFDTDRSKTGRVINGCRCHPMEDMETVIAGGRIRVGIVAVPASAAQECSDRLVSAGITGILNFAPVPLRVPSHVFLEDRDMTMSLETVAFFARTGGMEQS